MRITPFLLAGALAVGMSAGASAGPKGMGGGGMGHGMGHAMAGGGMAHGMGHAAAPRATGSVARGASYYAPGQVKKRMGVRSARSFAPGRNASGPYSKPPGHQFR